MEHGFAGDITVIDEKVAFIRSVFDKANMDAPREVREWYVAGQPVKRDTVFQICFAFGLDGGETDEFFRRIYTKERSFNCHLVQEAIYYFCLNNGLIWADALDIQSQVPLTDRDAGSGDVVYTGSIITELNHLESKEELLTWLNGNMDKFVGSNVTAYETIRRLWQIAAGTDGLLIREHRELPSMLDDSVMGKKNKFHACDDGATPCMCPRSKLWRCDGCCLECPYHAAGNISSLDYEQEIRGDVHEDQNANVEEMVTDSISLQQLLRRLEELFRKAARLCKTAHRREPVRRPLYHL